ncbi:MAG: hypothetical protein M1528_01115, partial [Candidatus Marsarchaeota archaeon]|jgi:hypothetical protein|nr:hypothetical protein [Candidatus Marsarchaeota archaeon]MCL5115118.1 hypothetical protein [Candidatus Marsarchaeota archaeon]
MFKDEIKGKKEVTRDSVPLNSEQWQMESVLRGRLIADQRRAQVIVDETTKRLQRLDTVPKETKEKYLADAMHAERMTNLLLKTTIGIGVASVALSIALHSADVALYAIPFWAASGYTGFVYSVKRAFNLLRAGLIEPTDGSFGTDSSSWLPIVDRLDRWKVRRAQKKLEKVNGCHP